MQIKNSLKHRFARTAIPVRNLFRRLHGRPLLSWSGQPMMRRGRKEIPANIRIDARLNKEFFDQLELNDLEQPDVSLVIVSYNRPDLVENLVKSIWLFSEGYRYEIIVIENGSKPGKCELAPEIAQRVRLIQLEEREYLGEAYNVGVVQAKGEYVVLLNNDIVGRPHWLSALLIEIERDPKVGAVGPKFLFPTGEIQEAGALIDRQGYPVQRGRGKSANDPEFNRREEVDYCSGATLALRRDLFLDLGGYHRMWSPGYYEDADLCFKLRERELKVIYAPASEVFHIENATMIESPPLPDMNAIIEDNRQQFVRKWKHVLEKSDH